VFVDLEVLKKKISTFRGEGGRVRITDDGLMMEILVAWEQWKAPMKEFYKAIGVSQTGMVSIDPHPREILSSVAAKELAAR
jgi:hypothetical protein